MLTDRFGRVHDYLRISLIDRCNLRCHYCMPEDIRFLPMERLMQASEVKELAALFVETLGVKKIRLTGGEPLIRKDAAEIIEALSALPVRLALTTNGILLDQFLDQLKAVGMKSLTISLDSLREDRFAEITRRKVFSRVQQNIRRALEAGFKVKLNMVVMRGINTDELCDFVALTESENIHVRFIEFMPFDGNHWKWDTVFSYAEMLALIESRYRISKLEDGPNSTAKAYQVEGFQGTFAVISTITAPFCETCNRIRLTAEGKIRNCLFARKEWDLLGALRKGEAVAPLIREAIGAKAARLGGLPEFQDQDQLNRALSERAMVQIGG